MNLICFTLGSLFWSLFSIGLRRKYQNKEERGKNYFKKMNEILQTKKGTIRKKKSLKKGNKVHKMNKSHIINPMHIEEGHLD